MGRRTWSLCVCTGIKLSKNKYSKVDKIGQQVRALVALIEHPNLVPRTHGGKQMSAMIV